MHPTAHPRGIRGGCNGSPSNAAASPGSIHQLAIPHKRTDLRQKATAVLHILDRPAIDGEVGREAAQVSHIGR
jgi:hypothetical protein